MKTSSILWAAAMLSLAGVISGSYAAPADAATVDDSAAAEASADKALDEGTVSEPLAEAPEEGTASEPLACMLDTCRYVHDWCRCSNTGWWGYCDWGPHRPGCIYCHCD